MAATVPEEAPPSSLCTTYAATCTGSAGNVAAPCFWMKPAHLAKSASYLLVVAKLLLATRYCGSLSTRCLRLDEQLADSCTLLLLVKALEIPGEDKNTLEFNNAQRQNTQSVTIKFSAGWSLAENELMSSYRSNL